MNGHGKDGRSTGLTVRCQRAVKTSSGFFKSLAKTPFAV
jgi:hypothetical protein